jgi:hypothetical protein
MSYRQEFLGCRRLVVQGAARTNRVEVTSHTFDQNFGLLHTEKYLHVQQFVTQLAVKAFTITIFPRIAQLDVRGCL